MALMHIGIDATCWWNRRGFGRFTRGLLPAMFAAGGGHRFYLFTDQPLTNAMAQFNVEIIQVPTSRSVTSSAVAGDRRSLREPGRHPGIRPLERVWRDWLDACEPGYPWRFLRRTGVYHYCRCAPVRAADPVCDEPG